MPGCSSARSEDARVSVTSSPARRSAASSSGRESGLRPGRVEGARAPRPPAPRASAAGRRGAAAARAGRRAGARGRRRATAPRRTSSRPRPGRPPTPPRAAARAGRPRPTPPRRPAAGRPRGRPAGARPCRRPRTEPGRTACSARAGPSAPTAPPPAAAASTAGARRSRWWPSRRSWQRSTRTPAASSGGYHRAVSSHTQRGASASRVAHVRRQVGDRHLALGVPVHDQHPVARQARERDPGHADTLASQATSLGPWRRMGGNRRTPATNTGGAPCRARRSRSTPACRRTR